MFYNLQDYIAVKEKYATYLPHTAGRYAAKRFRKAQVNDRKLLQFCIVWLSFDKGVGHYINSPTKGTGLQ